MPFTAVAVSYWRFSYFYGLRKLRYRPSEWGPVSVSNSGQRLLYYIFWSDLPKAVPLPPGFVGMYIRRRHQILFIPIMPWQVVFSRVRVRCFVSVPHTYKFILNYGFSRSCPLGHSLGHRLLHFISDSLANSNIYQEVKKNTVRPHFFVYLPPRAT